MVKRKGRLIVLILNYLLYKISAKLRMMFRNAIG